MVADGAISHRKDYVTIFKETRRYGPLHGPTSSSCGGLRPAAKAFFGQKKELIMLFCSILGHIWCPVVTLVTGCSSIPNLGTDGHACLSVPILGTDEQISKNLKKFFF